MRHLALIALMIGLSVPIASAQLVSTSRLNKSQPIINQSMFEAVGSNSDGDNINGPSVIRVPDWIDANDRPDASAQYYMYFAHHGGSYIRMAWAADLEGPWTLFNTGSAGDATVNGMATPGNGVLDLDLNDGGISIPNSSTSGAFARASDHMASPDVRIDNVNERIAMYFHATSSTGGQKTFVATSADGLNFNLPADDGQAGHGPVDVIPGHFYFRTFEIAGRAFAYSNRAELYRGPAQTNAGQPATLANANDEGGLWNPPGTPNSTAEYWQRMDTSSNPIENLYDNILNEGANDPRHFAVLHNPASDPDRIYIAYSARKDAPESILLSVVDLAGLSESERQDPANWNLLDLDPDTADDQFQLVLLEPEEKWEGADLSIDTSSNGSATGVRELRDPYFFQDSDGQLYLFYTGRGEEAIGIASVTIPEPASVSLLALGGMVLLRRRRRA